jgi:hypothetical protein
MNLVCIAAREDESSPRTKKRCLRAIPALYADCRDIVGLVSTMESQGSYQKVHIKFRPWRRQECRTVSLWRYTAERADRLIASAIQDSEIKSGGGTDFVELFELADLLPQACVFCDESSISCLEGIAFRDCIGERVPQSAIFECKGGCLALEASDRLQCRDAGVPSESAGAAHWCRSSLVYIRKPWKNSRRNQWKSLQRIVESANHSLVRWKYCFLLLYVAFTTFCNREASCPLMSCVLNFISLVGQILSVYRGDVTQIRNCIFGQNTLSDDDDTRQLCRISDQ